MAIRCEKFANNLDADLSKKLPSDLLRLIMETPPLTPSFYQRSAPEVAKELLGKILVTSGVEGPTAGIIVEVEAYLADSDPASHSYRGITQKNRSMFALGGTCYVYLCYGMHYCTNVVTGDAGLPEAVLLRAVEPLLNLDLMAQRRQRQSQKQVSNRQQLWSLCSGPGKLTQAFGIGISDDGGDFFQPSLKIIEGGIEPRSIDMEITPRIGISTGTDLPLRYTVRRSRWLSR